MMRNLLNRKLLKTFQIITTNILTCEYYKFTTREQYFGQEYMTIFLHSFINIISTVDIFHTMLYASPVWFGLLKRVLGMKLRLTFRDTQSYSIICSVFFSSCVTTHKADSSHSNAVLNDYRHVLNHMLPPIKDV